METIWISLKNSGTIFTTGSEIVTKQRRALKPSSHPQQLLSLSWPILWRRSKTCCRQITSRARSNLTRRTCQGHRSRNRSSRHQLRSTRRPRATSTWSSKWAKARMRGKIRCSSNISVRMPWPSSITPALSSSRWASRCWQRWSRSSATWRPSSLIRRIR